jgi:hypothetical protein
MILLINAVFEQLKKNILFLIKLLLIPGLILFVTFKIGKSNGIEVSDLTRDTAAVLHGGPWIGVISMLGLFLWSAAATIALVSASVLKKGGKSKELRKVLFFGGCLSLFLGFDDAFEMHEVVFENLFPFAEKLFYLVYIGSILGYMIFLKDALLKTDFVFWLGAMGMFFASMVLDNVDPFISHMVYYEDCFKFSGIFLWAVFYIRTGYHALTGAIK